MSLNRSAWRYLGLLVIAALAVGVFAGPASAKKLNKQQRAKVTKQLRKEIKKNPKAISKKSFLRRAALVNFKLPVTLALRTGDLPGTAVNEAATRNSNRATVDLGASLGQREVNLGGKLAAEITFADSYDGGALGNVKIDILPSNTKSLTSTSIPLLWNTQVTNSTTNFGPLGTGTRWDANALDTAIPGAAAAAGCGNFVGNSNLAFGQGLIDSPFIPGPDAAGLPGYPLHQSTDPEDPGAAYPPTNAAGNPEGFLPQRPGVDAVTRLAANKDPNNPESVGGNPSPFPTGDAPGGFTQPPNVNDSVLRTAPLALSVAASGTNVQQAANTNGVNGSQNITIGKSGGEANLFGNIPGKAYGIDVTVSLATRISSILRIVDQDSWGQNLVAGKPWPAGVFGCRQVYTGAVQNYIPGVRLTGSLKIAPGINSNGNLRIAKATVTSQAGFPTRFAVAACLAPYASYQAPINNSDTVGGWPLPNPTGGVSPDTDLPVNVDAIRPTPSSANCNDPATGLVRTSAMAPAQVPVLAPAAPANGYTVTSSGASVTVGADLNVNNVTLDVLIGDV